MAASFPSAHRRALLALAALQLVAPAPVPAATHDARAPIDLEAASSDFDYKNNTLLFKRVRISQGPLQVEAMEASATGLNFENSQWTFKGQVRITVPDGKLAANDAAVTFRDNEITRAVIRGTPATFEQRLSDSRQLAQGRANTIEYDVQASTVRLVGAAWLTDGQNEIRGNTLVYDIGQQRVAANPDETDPGGVRITILPKETPQPAEKRQEPREKRQEPPQ